VLQVGLHGYAVGKFLRLLDVSKVFADTTPTTGRNAVDVYVSSAWAKKACKETDEGRLAGTIGADHGQAFSS
jgi:hypothetical protein